ncbi:hypothetical protein N3K66_006500 [Trichothecium roseum]|uniref:Uncharacterized protein n=1 Tax=Trichothecium roseum TaxID=47278 RepID=A0ACC0UXB8_9HYPO|nr:hypothetical protein N3K66_006500 [Trichothecium roseum]
MSQPCPCPPAARGPVLKALAACSSLQQPATCNLQPATCTALAPDRQVGGVGTIFDICKVQVGTVRLWSLGPLPAQATIETKHLFMHLATHITIVCSVCTPFGARTACVTGR